MTTVVLDHDERLVSTFGDDHRNHLDVNRRGTALTAERCEAVELAPLFHAERSRPVDAEATYQSFSELMLEREELGVRKPVSLNFEADRNVKLSDFFNVLRGFKRIEKRTDFATILFVKVGEASVWSRPSMHAHTCGLKVLISDDGLREGDFANFEELFSAAARGG